MKLPLNLRFDASLKTVVFLLKRDKSAVILNIIIFLEEIDYFSTNHTCFGSNPKYNNG